MKTTKKSFISLLVIIFTASILFSGCGKEEPDPITLREYYSQVASVGRISNDHSLAVIDTMDRYSIYGYCNLSVDYGLHRTPSCNV